MRFAQVLEVRTESQDVLESLTALSKLYQQNTVASRRQLRARIEERGITTIEQFLSAAQGVIQVLFSYVTWTCSSVADKVGCSSVACAGDSIADKADPVNMRRQ